MIKYTHKELKKFINNFEYRFDHGQYQSLDFGDDVTYNEKEYVFNIVMWLGYKLFVVCDCEIVKGQRIYTITKVIFIDRDFKVHEFETFDAFVTFIPTLSYITEIHEVY